MDVLERLQNNAIKIGEDIKELVNRTGDLTTLQTNDKSSAVNAINELQTAIGGQITGTGRPDKPDTLTPAVAALVANASNLTVFKSTDGAGVNAYEWQLQNGKWQPTAADTGRLTIAADNFADIDIRRINNTVYLSVNKWSGTRCWLPYGFGAAYNGVVSTNADAEPIGKFEIIGQNMHRLQSDQMYPYFGTDPNPTRYWQHRPQTLRASFKSSDGSKFNISYLSEQPYPDTLAVSPQSRNLLPVTVNVTPSQSNRMTGSNNVNANWKLAGGLAADYSNPAFPAGIWHDAGGVLTLTFPTSGVPAHSKTDIHIVPTTPDNGGGANALNGAVIEYTLDGTTWVSGLTLSGFTDSDPLKQIHTLNVANIQAIRISKPSGILAIGGVWVGVHKQ